MQMPMQNRYPVTNALAAPQLLLLEGLMAKKNLQLSNRRLIITGCEKYSSYFLQDRREQT